MDIKKIRHQLGLSARQFADLIGYQDDRTIRRIEAGEQSLSGSAEIALSYILQGRLDDQMKQVIPEHIIGTGADGDKEFIIRMYAPRFLGIIGQAIDGLEHIRLVPDGSEAINIIMWIDDPRTHDTTSILKRAATDFEIYTQDSINI